MRKKHLLLLPIAAIFMMMGAPCHADTHSDICDSNYSQCMTGCDGMESCSNQCQTNYNGCMDQGG